MDSKRKEKKPEKRQTKTKKSAVNLSKKNTRAKIKKKKWNKMFDKKCEKWSTNKVNASIGAYQRGFFPLYCFISPCSALGWKLWGGSDHNAVYLAACISFFVCVWAWECVLLFNIGFSVFGAFSFLLTQLVVYIWNVESFEFSAFSTYICLVRLIWFVSIKRVARFERSLNSSVNYTFWVFSIFKTILYNARGFTIRCWYSTAFWFMLL